jgi:hypothetical protein
MRRAAAAVLFLAFGAAAAPPEVAHEYVAVDAKSCVGKKCKREGRAEPEPDAEGAPEPGEPVYTPQPLTEVIATGPPLPGDPPPERRDRVVPDRDTGQPQPGTHPYHEVFDPAIVPHKRMTALDAVADDESLHVFDPTRRPFAESPSHVSTRDVFSGSVALDLQPGRWVPLPSVSAETRILSHQLLPESAVQFARDSADNLFVRASGASGPHRLLWKSDAPKRYFAGELPRGLRLADEPPALIHPLSPSLREKAERVIAKIGVDRRRSLPEMLDKLVEWFRSFELGPLGGDGRSTYLDLALGRRGACRHRAYAFTITAVGLGIPTRYVENELHAFVEVYLPQLGWRQIDLGGAPLDEDVQNVENKSFYRPTGEDPFPKPQSFQNEPSIRMSDARSPTAMSSGGPGTGGTGGNGGTGTGTGTGNGGGGSSTRSDSSTPSDEPPRFATALSVTVETREAFRGDLLHVRGHYTVTGGPQNGARVILDLVGDGGRAFHLGDAVTDDKGDFSADLEVPRLLPLGDHRLVAHTEGDEKRAPAVSSH